jgi:hypothetical protein
MISELIYDVRLGITLGLERASLAYTSTVCMLGVKGRDLSCSRASAKSGNRIWIQFAPFIERSLHVMLTRYVFRQCTYKKIGSGSHAELKCKTRWTLLVVVTRKGEQGKMRQCVILLPKVSFLTTRPTRHRHLIIVGRRCYGGWSRVRTGGKRRRGIICIMTGTTAVRSAGFRRRYF